MSRPPREPRIVLAVGQRVFVHGPIDVNQLVPLTDENGIPATASLRDGTEVEVLAWRPRGSAGTRYRICDRADGADGWLGADELRKTAVRPAPALPPPPAAPSPYSPSAGRPFGSRS
jgi:hypothetical protein